MITGHGVPSTVADVSGLAEEVRREMRDLATLGDTEVVHGLADGLLIKLIRAHGHGDIATAFEALDKWYA